MNCLDLRRALGADPALRTPEIEAHLLECAACAKYAADLAHLEARLKRALEIPVPPPGAARPRPAPRLWALAASVAGAAIVVATLWTFYPRESLATALVGHMAHEPYSRRRTDQPVAPATLAYVLKRSGVELAPDVPLVTYAQSCWFRGWFVPHLVVQTADGPMTVMVLRHEHPAARTLVLEGGYRVLIVPVKGGAIAVLTEGPVDPAVVNAAVARVVAAVRF